MKKLICIFLLLPFFVDAQIHNQLRARQVIADSNVTFRRIRVDSMRLDTGTVIPWLNDLNSGATVDPIFRLIKGRQDWTINYANGLAGCQNKLLTPYSINYAGTNYNFIVSAGNYSIDCQTYSNVVTPVSLSAADPSNDRTDVIYLDATGVHILQGVVAPPGTSVKPLVQGDQIELTHIVVLAGTTTPAVTELVIYDENTESTAAGTGVTVNSAATTPAPYSGTVSTTVGALTNNDLIIWTKVSGSWATLGMDAMQFFIKLSAVMLQTDNLRVTLWNGSQQVSPVEVVISINKNDITNWQPVSISMGAFGQLLNTNVTAVRFRATINTTNNSLPQVDRMVFVDGIVSPPDALVTAGEGLTKLGNQINFGGIFGSPGTYTVSRWINQNRKTTVWTNGNQPDIGTSGAEWNFDQEVHSPYQFLNSDTVNTNDVDPPTAGVPWSGIYARRDLYYPTGVFRTQKVFGHQFEMRWKWDDTLSLNTQKGDYNTGVSFKNIFKPYGTGRQGIRAAHGTGQNNSRAYAAPSLLAVTELDNDGSNWIKVDGHLSGVNSYLVMGIDTIGKYIYYTTGSFINASSKINISYDFAPEANSGVAQVDSAYSWFDTARVKFQHFAGRSVWGPSRGTIHNWSSSDIFKVIGNANITDSLHLGKAHNSGTLTGFRSLIRRTSDGAVFEVEPSLFGGSVPNLQEVTDVGSVTTNNIDALTLRTLPTYTSDWVGDLGFSGNGITARGELTLRELSDGTGNFVTLAPLDMASDITLFLPHETDGDTLSTRKWVRDNFSGGGGTTETASNGLNKVVNDIQLGGPLTSAPTITSSGFGLTISGSTTGSTLTLSNAQSGVHTALSATASDASGTGISSFGGNIGLSASSTNGIGLFGSSTNGYGMQASSTGTSAADYQTHRTSTNTVVPVITTARFVTGGNGANGVGSSFDFAVETSTGTGQLSTQLISELTDATNGSRTAQFRIANVNNASMADVFKIGGGAEIHVLNGTAPTASIANGVLLYSEDVSSSAELKVRDEATNITTLSPHNFTGIPKGRFGKLSWAFYSERGDEYINVDMEKAMRTIEEQSKEIEELKELVYKLSGKKYTKKEPVKLVYTGNVNNKPNPNNK